jgi:hypothetical protein
MDHDHTLQCDAKRTWRYVRVAIVALVLLILTSVAIESLKEGRVLTSISDYYYTPARSCFVGGLIGIAICMICLRGNTDTEDVLLNLAGMLAPVVAFVPTPDPPVCTPMPGDPCIADIANNVGALLIVGALVLLFAAFVVAEKPTTPAILGASAIWAAGGLAFLVERSAFDGNGHYTAAVALFACIFLVALSNAGGYREHKQPDRAQDRYRWLVTNPYSYIAGLMVVSSVLIFAVWLITKTAYVILAIELDLIGLFGAFWVVQTKDLWNAGLRPVQPTQRFIPSVTRSMAPLLGPLKRRSKQAY